MLSTAGAPTHASLCSSLYLQGGAPTGSGTKQLPSSWGCCVCLAIGQAASSGGSSSRQLVSCCGGWIWLMVVLEGRQLAAAGRSGAARKVCFLSLSCLCI